MLTTYVYLQGILMCYEKLYVLKVHVIYYICKFVKHHCILILECVLWMCVCVCVCVCLHLYMATQRRYTKERGFYHFLSICP